MPFEDISTGAHVVSHVHVRNMKKAAEEEENQQPGQKKRLPTPKSLRRTIHLAVDRDLAMRVCNGVRSFTGTIIVAIRSSLKSLCAQFYFCENGHARDSNIQAVPPRRLPPNAQIDDRLRQFLFPFRRVVE